MSKQRSLKKAKRPLDIPKPQGRTEPVFKLIREQNKLYSYAAQYTLNKAVNALSLLIESAFGELYNNTFSKSATGAYHKHLFAAYSGLVQSFEIALNLCAENIDEVIDDKNKNILSGINSVVTSRLNEYKDNDYNLYYEKKIKSVDEYLYGFFKDVNMLIKTDLKKKLHELTYMRKGGLWNISQESLAKYIDEIKDFIIAEFSTSIFDIYETRLFEAISRFDEENSICSGEEFLQSIKNEMNILSDMVTIQIPELENESDQLIIQKYLSVLRQAYQNLGRDIQIADNMHKNTLNFCWEKENYYAFLKQINIRMDKKGELYNDSSDFYRGYESLREAFENHFINIIEGYTSKRTEGLHLWDSLKIAEEMKEKGSQMIHAVVEEFSEITGLPYVNEASSEDNDYLIIKGILETVEIKIESLKESFDEYCINIQTLNDEKISFARLWEESKKPLISQALKEYEENFDDYIIFSKQSSKEIMTFLGKNSFKISKIIEEQFNKKTTARLEKLNSVDFKFKRESLLFEVSTFEEILNYSVSKLMESQSAEVIAFAERVLACGEKICEILSSFGIDIIDPKPHEMFNGKIHEVLMANPVEGFAKGEIVKVVNKGYQKNDTIYIRANVICAK